MQQQDYVHQSDSAALQKRPSVYQKFLIDLPILFLLLALMGFGLTVLYSADSSYLYRFQRQIMNLTVGVVVMCLIAQVHPKYFKYWSPILYVIGIIMLLLVSYTALGVKANGSTRWLSMPLIGRFQPSEIIKLALPIVVAGYLGSKAMPVSLKHVLVALIIILVPVVLINRQPDLGTSLLIAASGLLVIFFAGLRWLYISLAAILSVVLGWVMWMFVLADYQKTRITAVIGNADLHAEGYNSHQAAIAIGSGGMYGKGFDTATLIESTE